VKNLLLQSHIHEQTQPFRFLFSAKIMPGRNQQIKTHHALLTGCGALHRGLEMRMKPSEQQKILHMDSN
jgi:hypothetical protein